MKPSEIKLTKSAISGLQWCNYWFVVSAFTPLCHIKNLNINDTDEARNKNSVTNGCMWAKNDQNVLNFNSFMSTLQNRCWFAWLKILK